MENVMKKSKTRNRESNIRKLVTISMLGAVSVVLMLFSTPIWFAPPNYKLDLSEVPVLIGSFAMGPIAGVTIEFLKIMLNLIIDGTDTMFVGEFANFIMGCAIVVPSTIIYNYKKNKKSAIIGMLIGTAIMTIVASVLNAYILLPVYAKAFKMPIDALIGMGTKVNPKVTDLKTFIILAVAPFNLVKGLVSSLLTFLLYKKISTFIKGFNK